MLKVAVIDPDEEYLKQLSAYMLGKRNSCMELTVSCKWDDFWTQEPQNKYDAILVSVSFWEKIEQIPNNSRIILLCEDEIPLAAEKMPAVLKYQAAGSIISAVTELLHCQGQVEEPWIRAVRGEVIGVYSPAGHDGQMMFSMTLGQLLGEGKKVLYLNFIENSGFSRIYQTKPVRGLSDIFAAVMAQRNISHAIACAAVGIGKADCILPVHNPEHLLEFTEEHYMQLFQELSVHSGYDIVIADFGRIFPGFRKVLQQCSSVYCIGADTYVGRCRMQEFEDYLSKHRSTADILHKLILPEGMGSVPGEDFLQKGVYGYMGDYIRKNVLGGRGLE